MFGYDWAAGFVSPFSGKEGNAFVTPSTVIDRLLDLIDSDDDDCGRRDLIDLGSGDGRIVLAAARRGWRARGIELDEGLVAACRAASAAEGLDTRATFTHGSLIEQCCVEPNADLVTYLLPEALRKVAARLAATSFRGRLFSIRWSVDDDFFERRRRCEVVVHGITWAISEYVAAAPHSAGIAEHAQPSLLAATPHFLDKQTATGTCDSSCVLRGKAAVWLSDNANEATKSTSSGELVDDVANGERGRSSKVGVAWDILMDH